jgi:hypothetical protein
MELLSRVVLMGSVFTVSSYILAFTDEYTYNKNSTIKRNRLELLKRSFISPITIFGTIVGISSAVTIVAIEEGLKYSILCNNF